MTVTNQKSTQITNREAGTINESVTGTGGRMWYFYFDCAQAALGCANSTFEFVVLPPGKWRYISWLSRVATTAFGTARTLDVGVGAYTNPDGTAVSAAASAIHSAKDVSAAANWAPGQSDELDDAAGDDGTYLINSKTSVTITGICKAGTATTSARVKGMLAFLGS